jgi:hypothetical protein
MPCTLCNVIGALAHVPPIGVSAKPSSPGGGLAHVPGVGWLCIDCFNTYHILHGQGILVEQIKEQAS